MTDIDTRRGVIELSQPVDVFLRIGARTILGVAIMVFLIALLGGNLPNDPEGGALTDGILVPLQFVLLLATAVGLALSFRWMAIAAGTVAFAGTGIAIISALQYESPTPILVSVAFLVPALMMWLDWQCRETLGKIVVLAVTTSTLFAATWFGSNAVYDHYFGPTHPESDAIELPDSLVQWVWSGAVDTDGFTVNAVLRRPSSGVSLVVADSAGATVWRSEPVAVAAAGVPVRFAVDGLEPDTDLTYVLESLGDADDLHAGSVTTFPEGPATLTLAFVGGDAHMVAIDDGTNSGYGGHDGFPVLQVAALDRPGSIKGGPYTSGEFPGGGHFGVVEVTDLGGDTIDVELIGLDWESTVLANLHTTFAVPG